MNETIGFLIFTKESPSDFEDGRHPTLDINISIDKLQIWYMFYQKTMCNNIVMQEKSALSEMVKTSSLTEEIVRTLRKKELPNTYRMENILKSCAKNPV